LTTPKEIAQCDEAIVEHHYLRSASLVGEHLRYGFFYKGRCLALATWSAAAFHIKDRDRFIGWSAEQCRRRRALVANNSRLLVMPDCHFPNLISRLMKLMLGRLSEDWQERWGHPIALVETFVDPRQFIWAKPPGGNAMRMISTRSTTRPKRFGFGNWSKKRV
jgi:hypothetical protein